jgi:hypothetical protein
LASRRVSQKSAGSMMCESAEISRNSAMIVSSDGVC